MMYHEINPENITFKPFTDHNPGKSCAIKSFTANGDLINADLLCITDWMKITSNPRMYTAMTDRHGNKIERVNVFTECPDKFRDWIFQLEKRAKDELIEQKIDKDPESHWNHLLAHKKYLRCKLHVMPSKMLQCDCYVEGDDTPFKVELKKVSTHFFKGVEVRYMLEVRPVLHKNGRSGITFRIAEVQFKKKPKSKLVEKIEEEEIEAFALELKSPMHD